MRSWDALPETHIQPVGPLSQMAIARGIGDLRVLGRYLQSLPYGRTADRADYRGVLTEQRGTCSTKHALLAAIAAEQGTPLQLTLGIYAMTEANTPGVGSTLAAHGLVSIPEAHCFVTYRGERIDVTRSGAEAAEPIGSFLHEEVIQPEQIGDYKLALHRQWMRRWLASEGAASHALTFDQAWAIREACIAALGE